MKRKRTTTKRRRRQEGPTIDHRLKLMELRLSRDRLRLEIANKAIDTALDILRITQPFEGDEWKNQGDTQLQEDATAFLRDYLKIAHGSAAEDEADHEDPPQPAD